MKYSVAIAAAAAAAVSAAADPCSTANVPSCVQTELQPFLSAAGCAADDLECLCSKQAEIQGKAASVIAVKCPNDVSKAISATTALCKAVEAGKCGSSESSSSAAASTSSAASSAQSSAASSAAATTTGYPEGTAPTGTGSMTTAVATTGSSNGTAPAPTSSIVTAGAAIAGSVGSFAMVVLGALAL